MMSGQALEQELRARLEAAVGLDVAYVGVANGLFSALADLQEATPRGLAETTGCDAAYTQRWCDAAYAFEYLSEAGTGRFSLTDLGRQFVPEIAQTGMPAAVQAVLGAHMAERASALMRTGERPGEAVLAERETIMPLFGPMLEAQFGPLLEREILARIGVFAEADARGGLVVDLGCGNGWYLRRLLSHFPTLRGLGLDTTETAIEQARTEAARAGLAKRLRFDLGDLADFASDEPADLIAMNRALHHVWDDRERVVSLLYEHLKPGGAAVIWEPAWPADRTSLRESARRVMAFQNLAEHVQGNRFLHPDEIEAALRDGGLLTETHVLGDGRDVVIVGRRPS